MSEKVFNVAVFFVVFRECLEAAVIVSVLLSFVNQSLGNNSPALRKKLWWQVWLGVALGFLVCLIIGGAMIGVYYRYNSDIYGKSEDLWEAIFCFIATIMISVMGLPMLRISKLQTKWRVKLAQALLDVPERKRDRFRFGALMKRYAMFLLPCITVLREGLEAIVFVAGVGTTAQGAAASSYPLPVIVGLIAGAAVGTLLYYGASRSSMQIFLIFSTCLLYLIAAGLCSRGAWYAETYRFNIATGGDASESGSGNGSYNILQTVYHINCCNPSLDKGWDIFNALLGWQNTGYLASILAYNLYWLVIIAIVSLMIYDERRGHLPFTRYRLSDLNPLRRRRKELSATERDELFERAGKLGFEPDGRIAS
ncbi:AaceriAEL294Cp [[Ashbya] aceris (nom. inval.)]|nr:AaceriAEL294Cp [[Ashbya] aceris (nom. inval.)]